MHTFKTEETTFSYNADLTGFVVIKRKDGQELVVRGSDLLQFVANRVRQQRISELEKLDWKEVLGIAKR